MCEHSIFVDGSNCICYMDRYLRNNYLKVNNQEISRNAFKKFRWDPYKIGDYIINYGKHLKYKYKDSERYNMYFASSISCRFSQKLENKFNALGYNTFRESHTNNDKEMDVDTYLHQSILNESDICRTNTVFYIVTGDVNSENKFSFPELVEFLAHKKIYVSILTPGKPHYKFVQLQRKYPKYVQVKSLSAIDIINIMIHKNLINL